MKAGRDLSASPSVDRVGALPLANVYPMAISTSLQALALPPVKKALASKSCSKLGLPKEMSFSSLAFSSS